MTNRPLEVMKDCLPMAWNKRLRAVVRVLVEGLGLVPTPACPMYSLDQAVLRHPTEPPGAPQGVVKDVRPLTLTIQSSKGLLSLCQTHWLQKLA